MVKKVYSVTGFDCAHCASKAEEHISKHEDVSFAHMDFSTNTLYITFKKEYWDVEKLADIIKEVESDPLEISFKENEVKTNNKLFTNTMWWILGRIIFSLIACAIAIFVLGDDSFRYVRFGIYGFLVVLNGYDIVNKIIQHIIHKTNIIDHNLLMVIAALGALTLAIINAGNPSPSIENGSYVMAFDEALESAMVLILFQVGRLVESIATNKSKKALSEAISLRLEKAKLVKEEEIVEVAPEMLAVEDIILVTSGDMIPVDGIVLDGEAYLDTSSITGEFTPVRAKEGDELFSGYLVKEGNLHIKVQKTYQNSHISKVIQLISEGNERKSKADEFIAKFAKWYTPIICLVAILVLVLGGLISKDWMSWTNKSLEVLVTGCPCAVVISVPLAYFSGIGLASKNGIVIKGSNYLDRLYEINKILLDKTGTLTKGVFKIEEVVPNIVRKEDLLEALYAAECLSNHPIGKAICIDIETSELKKEQSDYLEIAGKGVSTTYKGKRILAGNASLLNDQNIDFSENDNGLTTVYCAVDGRYYGYVTLNDELKVNVNKAISYFKSNKIETVLVTGDKKAQALDLQNKLSLDRVHYELYPEDKLSILNKEKDTKSVVAFVGDGINDAPSLVQSDVGIAMGGIGSDIAVENADVIIMNDDPYSIVKAIKVSKKARHSAIFNIVFALVVKISIMFLAILNKTLSDTLLMTLAVLADTGLTVVLVINSLLLINRKV